MRTSYFIILIFTFDIYIYRYWERRGNFKQNKTEKEMQNFKKYSSIEDKDNKMHI